ncbi:MAG: hypothetical protein WC812_03775 [Candidatus Pacearchaeota archaeon]|jgi:uncharacterized HAD superfamily protein
MKIAIDIDEIVVEYLKSFLKFLNAEKKININYYEVLDYNNLCSGKGLNLEQVQEYIQEHTSGDSTLLNLELIKGSLDSINFLENNHEIFFVTSRHVSNEEKTRTFFKKHFPHKEFKIIFSGDAWGGNKSKSEICFEENCSILIEDNLSYAKDCARKGVKVLLLNKPWNQNFENYKNIVKVNDWNEILEKINEFEKQEAIYKNAN